MLNILNKHKSIIVLNGTAPDKTLLAHVCTQVPIIAADGAAAKLRLLGLDPTYVVGDGDSFDKNTNSLATATILSSADQDSTDFEKCLLFVQQQQMLPSLILGISGGEIDHVLGNMQALIKHAQDQSLYFLDTYENSENQLGIKIGIPVSSTPLTLALEPNSLISIIPFYNTTVTTTGLHWELNNTALTTDSILGVRNISTGNSITFNVHEGKVLIIADITAFYSLKQ